MPVPLRTYHDEKAIYSVDMMVAYLATHDHPVVELPVEGFAEQMEQKVWGKWSPADVLRNPKAKRYAEDAERIKKADLKYPVIVTGRGHKLVDGYHRVAKAQQQGSATIRAVVFPASLMKRFVLDTDMNFVKVHQEMTMYQILGIWNRRFCK
jgi:hypothetical protein